MECDGAVSAPLSLRSELVERSHGDDALGAGSACLMANHGVLTVGATLDAAVDLAADVEWLAGVHRRAITLGEPVVLPDEEIARVAAQLESYGQPD